MNDWRVHSFDTHLLCSGCMQFVSGPTFGCRSDISSAAGAIEEQRSLFSVLCSFVRV